MSKRWRMLFSWAREQRGRYIAATIALLIGIACMIIRPLIVRNAIDYFISGKEIQAPAFVRNMIEAFGGRSFFAQNLWIISIAIFVTTLLAGGFHYLRGVWAAQAAEKVTRRLRNRLYDRLQRVPAAYHNEHPAGDLVHRCTSDVETVRMFLAMQVVEIGRGFCILLIMVPVLFWLDTRMALISMALLPGIVLFSIIFFVKVQRTFQNMDEAEGRMTAMLQENLTGIRVMRAFARQEHENKRFEERNEDYRQKWYRLISVLGYFWPLSMMMCHTQRGLVLIGGAYLVITTSGEADELTIGTLYVFIACVNMLLWPIQHMGRILADLGKALVSVGRIGEVLDEPEEQEPPTARETEPPRRPTGNLAVENLHFAHEGTPVLQGVSFCAEPGQTVAILGPSGSGKSTLIYLLLRLFDYERGTIRLDGRELSELPRQYVRSQIGVVMQEPFLYSRTLRENIMFGRSDAEEEEIVHAAASAAVHDSITGFDQGYDTLVGERGVTLSGGQRQRLALARALLRNPAVLVLDDALSAVDTRTESLILRALKRRRGKATTLVIAHRLTTLRGADKILVLDEGKIIQSGTHKELIAQEGMYKRLWNIQSALEGDFQKDLRAGKNTDSSSVKDS